MDSIEIQDIECWTHIGVPSEEREHEQCVVVSVEIFLDTKAAAKADDVSKSIDYGEVADHVLALAKKERKTLEKFAQDIADDLLKSFKPESVKVSATKRPLPSMKSATVTITRP